MFVLTEKLPDSSFVLLAINSSTELNCVSNLLVIGNPLWKSTNDKKSVFALASSNGIATKNGSNLSLSAPGAFSLLKPAALSNRVLSASDVITDSFTLNPTATLSGNLLYFEALFLH